MVSLTTDKFWKSFEKLPKDIQTRAKKAYELWAADPFHESLQFKRIHSERPIYSVRIGRDYRAVGLKEGDSIIWFWIGSHSDYDTLLKKI